MFYRCITGSGNSNVLFKRLVSSFIVISLLLCLCFSAGATPAEGDIDLYKGVIAGYAIVSGMQFYSWREVYQFSEDFFHRITTEQTPEQLNFINKISYTDFEEFDFYFLKFNSRPDVLSAFVSAVESTYGLDLNPTSNTFTDNFNIPKLLSMPAYYSEFNTSIGANSATDYGIIYNLGNRFSYEDSSPGLNLISTNNRGVSLYLYRGNSTSSNYIAFFLKLGEYYIRFNNNFNVSGINYSYIYPCLIFSNNAKVSASSSSDSSGRGVSISNFSSSVGFPTTYSLFDFNDTAESVVGNSYGKIVFAFAFYDSNGYLLGISYPQQRAQNVTYFGYNTDPAALFDYSSLGNSVIFNSGRSSFGSFLNYIYNDSGTNYLKYDISMRDVFLYNSNYSFSPINYLFNSKIKIPSKNGTITFSEPSELALSDFLYTLFSHSLGFSDYVLGTQIQPESNITINRSYLADSNSLYNQLLTEEKVIRVPYNMLELDTDIPNEEIPPTPPSIEDTNTPIGDISDSSQQVGDNLNGTSGSIDELGGGLLVPDIDLDGTLGNIPNDGANSISTFISMVMGPLMNYPIVTTLLLCLIGFTAIKLILYGTGRD